MYSKFMLFSWTLVFGIFACQAQQNQTKDSTKAEEKETTQPLVGGDSDAHGCKASAGYQWSELRRECIRVFEKGIRLKAKAEGLDPNLVAYLVMKSNSDDDAQVELFIPSEKKSIVLPRVGQNDAGTWKNEKYTLIQWRGMYSLENANKKLLYEGSAVE